MYPIIPKQFERSQKCPDPVRQCHLSSICEQVRRYKQTYVRLNEKHFYRVPENEYCAISPLSGWKSQHMGRRVVKDSDTLRMAIASRNVQGVGGSLGSTYRGPLCFRNDNTTGQVQFPVFRSGDRSGRCNGSSVVQGKQLCESAFLDVGSCNKENSERQSSCYSDCTKMEGANMVQTIAEVEYFSTSQDSKSSKSDAEKIGGARTIKKSQVDNVRLEDLWCEWLKKRNWSQNVINRFLMSWVPSTWSCYNRYFKQFVLFCEESGTDLWSVQQSGLAQFFVSVVKMPS